MMFSDDEISVFFDELEEKIQVLNENLLLIEREGRNEEALQEIFRAAHTIKGSSAVMGYEKMTSLTHELENVFDQIRKGKMDISGPLMDALFPALDTLNLLREEILDKGLPVEIEDVVASLGRIFNDSLSKGEQGQREPEKTTFIMMELPQLDDNLTEAEEDVIREAELRGFQAYWVTVHLDSATQMKSVRAYMVFEVLQQSGEVIKTEPPIEELQDDHFDLSFRIILLTVEDPDRLHNLLMTVSEVASVQVKRVNLNKDHEICQEEQTPVCDDIFEAAVTTKPTREGAGEGANAKINHAEKRAIQTVRVDVQKLDNLMNLVGELVIERTRLNRFSGIFAGRFGRSSGDLIDTLNEISSHLGQVTGDLQEQIMKARMLPVAQVFNRFPRMVRDLAQKLGKEVNFVVEGHETELDRNVIEIIGDPLIHLIRNALDHGLEEPEERVSLGKPRAGSLKLKASYMENNIVITIEDDGRGIDCAEIRKKAVEKGLIDQQTAEHFTERESLNLIFIPGFSMSRSVTDLSGRGVGMDVVRKQIESISGMVEVTSTVGAGARFIIKLPLTLAIIRAFMVELGGEQFALPLANVQMVLDVRSNEVKKIQHREVAVVRGYILPLARLADIFEVERMPDSNSLTVVVLGVGDKKIGLIVDKLLGEEEIVIKSLGAYLGKIPGLSGATILGDGKVALIVDARALVQELVVDEVLYAAN